MWDPLLNSFPPTIHGFRCMLALKYLLLLENNYEDNSVGQVYIRELISVLRAGDYVKASSRYCDLYPRIQGTSPPELRQPSCQCTKCPRHQKESMGEQAHVSETSSVPEVYQS
ncbi:AV2 [West African Asystasia virus 1]|uniref:Protein V2 n=1 Tax=West African Asystasia virus 1 TaxID=1046573 RepID=A0A190D9H2_9GEMI|nr:AV2 [West African Asystasia virus 1]ALQ10817.1 AV2 [West African Asystasia virus 1]